jgi:hypothetical protein
MVSYVLSYSSFWIHAHRKALVGGITLEGQDERKEGAVVVATGMAARARRNRHTSGYQGIQQCPHAFSSDSREYIALG